MPKHVASRTLTDTTWNATLIEGDVAEAVAESEEHRRWRVARGFVPDTAPSFVDPCFEH